MVLVCNRISVAGPGLWRVLVYKGNVLPVTCCFLSVPGRPPRQAAGGPGGGGTPLPAGPGKEPVSLIHRVTLNTTRTQTCDLTWRVVSLQRPAAQTTQRLLLPAQRHRRVRESRPCGESVNAPLPVLRLSVVFSSCHRCACLCVCVQTHCYYHGSVRGFPQSRVALSTCSGLRSVTCTHTRDKHKLLFLHQCVIIPVTLTFFRWSRI